MIKTRSMLAGLLLLGACPTAALAANDCMVLEPNVQSDPVLVLYDPFSSASAEAPIPIDVRTRDCPANRNIFLSIASPDPTVATGTILKFTGPGGLTIEGIVTNQRGRDAGGNDSFEVKAGIVTLYLRVPRGQVVPPGDYRARMEAQTRLNMGNNTPEARDPFDIIVRVGVAIGLMPVTGTGVDLGELSDNDTAAQPVTFDAYANVGYRLRLISDYGYVLRPGGNAAAPGAAYSPVLDTITVSTGAAERDFTIPSGDVPRRRHSLNARVPSIAGLPAGSYRDYLTVEITARVGD